MSQYTEPDLPRGGGLTAEPSTTDFARAEAAGVGQHARDASGQVAQTAVDQARQVAAETSRQARDLLSEAQGQALDQASAQQQQAARQLHSVADELHVMAANGGQSGLATEVARQVADRMHGAASWLEQREPADLLDEVRRFARRRPGTFLIGAAVAGLAAGRLTRGLAARNSNGANGTRHGITGGVPAAAGSGYPTTPYAAGAGSYDPGAPAYPASPTFTPKPGYLEGGEPAGPGGYPADPAEPSGQAYPAEPPGLAYPAEPSGPAYPAEPPYPADAGGTAGSAEPGSTAAYPPAPAYPADPGDTDPDYPAEPGAGPRYGGSR